MTAPLQLNTMSVTPQVKRPQLAVPGTANPMLGGPTLQQPRTVPNVTPPSIAGPPGAAGTQVQGIVPGQNDLRGTSITAAPSTRNQTAAGYTGAAAAQYAANPGITGFQGVNPNDPSTANASRLLSGAEGSIAGPPGYDTARAYGSQAASSVGGASIGQYGGVGSIRNPNAVSIPASGSYGVVGPGNYNPAADTLRARSAVSTGLEGLNSTPNRQELASRSLQLLEQEGSPAYEQELRQVGQKAAALGRIGSGMTTSDLGDVAQRRQESLARARERVSLDTAGQELQDRLNRLSATQGVFGQLGGEDRSNESVLAGQRGEARTERGFLADQDALRAQIAGQNEDRALSADSTRASLGLEGQRLALSGDQARAGLSMDKANLFRALGGDEAGIVGAERGYGLDRGKFLSGLSDQTFGQGASLRNEARGERDSLLQNETARFNADRSRFGDFNDYEGSVLDREANDRSELRGERGYQDDLANKAQQDAIDQYLMERDTRSEDFGMNQDQLDQLIRLGYLGDPAGLEGQNAAALEGQAAGLGGAAANGIAQLGARRKPGMSVTDATNVLDYTPQVVGPR